MKPIIGILDDCDAPEARNLVIVRTKRNGKIKWEYLARRIRPLSGEDNKIPALFTSISKFGVSLSLSCSLGILQLEQIGPSVAVYPDGKPRAWQGQNKMQPFEVRQHLVAAARRSITA